VHGMHTSAGWPKQALRVLAAMPTGEKSAAQICAAVGLSKENRQRRLLTNIGLTMDCPGHAGKIVWGIGWRELGLSRNSAAKTLAACTQRRIRQRRYWQPARRCEFGNARQLVQVRGLTWHDVKLGRGTVQGMWMTHQMTQQELAVGAAKWACRTWVSGSYGYPRSWDHGGWKRGGWPGVALNPLRSWEIMGENYPLLGR